MMQIQVSQFCAQCRFDTTHALGKREKNGRLFCSETCEFKFHRNLKKQEAEQDQA